MKYVDFVDLSHKPRDDELICDFYVEPIGIGIKEAAGGVAAESSIGTWTELTTEKSYLKKLHATVFEISGNNIRIAYPSALFEFDNMPNILSSVAGNVFGLGVLKNLRLNDVHFPPEILGTFKGPKFGVDGVRHILSVKDRPLVGTIIKPKLGLRTEDHAKVAFEAWSGGCDIVKDDENLGSQSFNLFEDRFMKTLESRDKVEEETGEKKVYMVNVTSETNKMMERVEFAEDHGGRYIMVDILTCGFASLQTLRNRDSNLVIHAHRAGHAAFTKNEKHGISMRVIAKVARVIGVDQLHVGTVVGKMSESRDEVQENIKALRSNMQGLKAALPVASGGIHPRLVPALIDIFGKDCIIQAGGGVHGHPDGTFSGAKAMREAVESKMNDIDLKEYAKTHNELRTALDSWR